MSTASPPSNTVRERNIATVVPATAPASNANPRTKATSNKTGNQRDFGMIGMEAASPMLTSGTAIFRRLSTLLPGTLLPGLVLPIALPAPGSSAVRRAPPAAEVCVLSPRVEAGADGRAQARVPLSRPTIFVREPLRQVRLQQGGRLLWQQQAALTSPLEGPIAWPLPPLRASERLELLLQPRDASPTAFATIEIEAAPAATLRRNEERVAALGDNPQTWQKAVEQALGEGDPALATGLLFAFEGPSAPELDALRREAFQRSCP